MINKGYPLNIYVTNEELERIFNDIHESNRNGSKIILDNIKRDEAKKILERILKVKIQEPKKRLPNPFKKDKGGK